MPSSEIHDLVGDELQAAAGLEVERRTRSRSPSAASDAEQREPRRERARRQSAPITATTSGQPDEDRERSCSGPARRDQEVEDDARRRRAAAARRSSAGSRSGSRARRREPARTIAGRPADEHAVDDDALERLLARSGRTPANGPHDEQVDQLVEVPLVARTACRRGAKRALPGAPAMPGSQHPDAVGERDAGERRSRCRARGRTSRGRSTARGST